MEDGISSKKLSIVDCAENLFLELGFSQTTTSLIAKKAMISKRTLYQYFENKEDLYKEVIKRNHHLFLDIGRAEQSDDFQTALVKIFMLDDSMDEEMEHKRSLFLRVSWGDAIQNPDLYDDLYNSGALKPRELLFDWLEDQVKLGKVHQGDLNVWANMLMAMILGVLVPKRRHFNSWRNVKIEAKQFINIFMKGI
jgi:AcrR family transcriptional regulator